jgi:RNA-binding protein YhbY
MKGKHRLSIDIQIGKNGLTDEILNIIKSSFKNRDSIKVILLKSAGHSKENTKETAEKIKGFLGDKFTYRTLGFTIFFQKWRKAKQ